MSAGYSTEMSVTRRDRGVRVAKMPIDGDVLFGVHGQLAEGYSKYAKEPDGYEPHASTLDYMVVCVGACLIDHFGAALEVRGFPTRDGQLTASIRGELDEDPDGCLAIRRVYVHYRLAVDHPDSLDDAARSRLERAHRVHGADCPVSRTLRGNVEIITDYELHQP
jgi:uncharacterized OsmC-like protein